MADSAAPAPVRVDEQRETELMTGEAVALDVRPTSFILRAAGGAIDVLVSVAVFLGLLWIIALAGTGADSALQRALLILAIVIAVIVVPVTVEVVTRGRSVGRLVAGARIVREDGGAVHVRQAFIRALMGVVELYMTLGGLAALIGLLNTRSRRLGDLLAGTYSQSERVPIPPIAAFGVPLELTSWAGIADVGRIPDSLSRRIAFFLAQAPRMYPMSRETLARELADEVAAYVSPRPAVHPQIFLAGVAAMRRMRDERAGELDRRRRARLSPWLDTLPHGFPER